MRRQYRILSFFLICLSFVCMERVFSATPINLQHQSLSFFNSGAFPSNPLRQIRMERDANQTVHTWYQQMFQGYPVWGGDVIAHNKKQMNGIFYQGLAADLTVSPMHVFSNTQAKMALQHSIQLSRNNAAYQGEMIQPKTIPMIYVDDNNKAHWVYVISFLMSTLHGMPAKPVYIMDASSFQVYEEWNDIKTLDIVPGGGYGGNLKTGRFTYDGLEKNFRYLEVTRHPETNDCFLKNANVIVKDRRFGDAVVHFNCDMMDEEHNYIYWNGDADFVNGGYSPSNDALYLGGVIKEMYLHWFNLPVLNDGGKPMKLIMRVHELEADGSGLENAYWDGIQMTFGDGAKSFYPLTTLGVVAHEIAHGFTEQHSDLKYKRQSGGLNESFSDMAAQAAEFYVTGQNTWQIGADILKADNEALRYMDEPTKDCHGGTPGKGCSISSADDYYNNMNVHKSSGVFNKVFYLMSTAPGWNTQKAFSVMVQANRFYWTSNTSFDDAACGVLRATHDLGLNSAAAAYAFAKVNIDINDCW